MHLIRRLRTSISAFRVFMVLMGLLIGSENGRSGVELGAWLALGLIWVGLDFLEIRSRIIAVFEIALAFVVGGCFLWFLGLSWKSGILVAALGVGWGLWDLTPRRDA